jgi:HEAT repeat protein
LRARQGSPRADRDDLLAQSRDPQAWLAALANGPAPVRAAVAFRFRGHPELLSPAVVAALSRALEDEDEAVRIEAARTIGGWTGAPLHAALADLARLLEDGSEPVRWEPRRRLWRAAPPVATLMPVLTRALESADEYVRSYASWTLGEAGVAAREAVPALVRGPR